MPNSLHCLLCPSLADGRGIVYSRTHDGDALAARPPGEVLEVAVAAARARVFRVNMEVCVEWHSRSLSLLWAPANDRITLIGAVSRAPVRRATGWEAAARRSA